MRRTAGEPNLARTVVAVTGGARGIGAAVAGDLVSRGALVAIGDRDLDSAKATVREVSTRARASGGKIIALPLDVTRPESFDEFLREVEAALGPVDILVNNAGVMWVGDFCDEPEEAARRQVDVNLHGVINGIKAAVPLMRGRGRGHLITIASAASKLTPRGEATYAATKHAVYGYCCAVQAELHGSGIKVSLVMPTVVETELAAGTSHGLIRRLQPADVAAGVRTAISTGRRDVFVPRPIGWLTRALAVLPERLSTVLGRLVVPNQLRLADRDKRRSYEKSL